MITDCDNFIIPFFPRAGEREAGGPHHDLSYGGSRGIDGTCPHREFELLPDFREMRS